MWDQEASDNRRYLAGFKRGAELVRANSALALHMRVCREKERYSIFWNGIADAITSAFGA